MKLFWKQFIMIMCFSVVPLAIVGNAMIQISFQAALDREVESSIEDMGNIYHVLLTSIQNMPYNYPGQDIAVAGFGRSLQKNMNTARDEIIIYNRQLRFIIYSNSSYASSSLRDKINLGRPKQNMWQIAENEGHYYLESMWPIVGGQEAYCLEMHHNLDRIYQDRDYMTYIYIIAMVAFWGLIFVATLLVSNRFTKPIRKLSQAVRELAGGNYKKRIRVRGKDEVAELGRDFNQMAEQIESGIVRLEEDGRRKEEFIAAFSHELKTPLTSIIGYADVMRTMKLPQDQQFMSAEYIFRQGKRLELLSRKMMELIYMDQKSLDLTAISVGELAEKLEKMIRPYMREKNLTWECRVKPGTIRGDSDLLLSLFSNLIDNARKACRPGGSIVLEGSPEPDGYFFMLRDNGTGIPEEEISKITEMFYMVDKSRSRAEGGSGIGMALCEKIIALHDAIWDISSKVGEGTCIRIWFPQKNEGRDARP